MNYWIAAIFSVLLLVSSAFAESPGPIKIGWIGPLTGNAAALGKDSAEALQMRFEQINAKGGIHGRPIKLVVEDDQYVTSKTVTAYKKLVHNDGIKVLIVITYGGLFAIAPQAERDGVLLLDPLDCNEDVAALPLNTICIAQMAEQLGFYNANHAVSNSLLPAGVIYFENDPFMGTLAKSTAKRFSELGHPVAFSAGYEAKTSDFKTLLLKAKSRGVKSLFFYGYDELGSGMKQARVMNLDVQFYATVTMTSPGFREAAGVAANGTVVSVWRAPRTERLESFFADFKERTGRLPTLEISTIPSVDAGNVIVDYLQRIPEAASGQIDSIALRDHFYQLKDYDGISGRITISPDGATRTLEVRSHIYDSGELREIS